MCVVGDGIWSNAFYRDKLAMYQGISCHKCYIETLGIRMGKESILDVFLSQVGALLTHRITPAMPTLNNLAKLLAKGRE